MRLPPPKLQFSIRHKEPGRTENLWVLPVLLAILQRINHGQNNGACRDCVLPKLEGRACNPVATNDHICQCKQGSNSTMFTCGQQNPWKHRHGMWLKPVARKRLDRHSFTDTNQSGKATKEATKGGDVDTPDSFEHHTHTSLSTLKHGELGVGSIERCRTAWHTTYYMCACL